MIKASVWLLPAILFFAYDFSEGLECYHCFSNGLFNTVDANFVPCNELNLTASNTWVCPSPKAQCIYQEVEIMATKSPQTWRTCSNGVSDPCDPNNVPPGIKMTKCSSCGTDRCNLRYKSTEKDSFTFNINANINLYIRQ